MAELLTVQYSYQPALLIWTLILDALAHICCLGVPGAYPWSEPLNLKLEALASHMNQPHT